MRLLYLLLLLPSIATANYSKFTSCYFQNHNFTQSVAQYIHDTVVQNKVVIFDDTPIGFSGRTVSNKGFYLDYDVENCNINFATMMSSCAIKPDTLAIKYGTRPSYLEPVYLSTIYQSLDRTNLDSFLSAIVSYPLIEGLEISSLGRLGINSDGNLAFSSSPFQVSFASAPAPAVYSVPCGTFTELNISVNGSGGTVSVIGNPSENFLGLVSGRYRFLTTTASVATITAIPNSGYSFGGWIGSAVCPTTATGNISIPANASTQIYCTVTFSEIGNWMGSTPTSVEVTAVSGDMSGVGMYVSHSSALNKISISLSNFITSWGDYEYGDYEEVWDFSDEIYVTQSDKDLQKTLDWPAHYNYDVNLDWVLYPARSVTVVVHGWAANRINSSITVEPILIGTYTQ